MVTKQPCYSFLMADLRCVSGRLVVCPIVWALIAHVVGIECPNSRTDFGQSI